MIGQLLWWQILILMGAVTIAIVVLATFLRKNKMQVVSNGKGLPSIIPTDEKGLSLCPAHIQWKDLARKRDALNEKIYNIQVREKTRAILNHNSDTFDNITLRAKEWFCEFLKDKFPNGVEFNTHPAYNMYSQCMMQIKINYIMPECKRMLKENGWDELGDRKDQYVTDHTNKLFMFVPHGLDIYYWGQNPSREELMAWARTKGGMDVQWIKDQIRHSILIGFQIAKDKDEEIDNIREQVAEIEIQMDKLLNECPLLGKE